MTTQRRATSITSHTDQRGMTLIELMVSLAIGSFLVIGAVSIYNQSRQAYVINDSIARVQETAQFAMDTIEADLRMAGNWGLTARGDAIEGRATPADPNPTGLTLPTPNCGAVWALDLTRPVVGDNNGYTLTCGAFNGNQANSDTLTVRRATVGTTALQNGRLQIQTSRMVGQVIGDGAMPAIIDDPLSSETHDLLVNSYYVSPNSVLIPGVPTLRRKSLASAAGAPVVTDIEVAPGIENLQVQFGVDMNDDDTIDRYVNPNDAILNPASGAWVPLAKVMTARVWIVVRSLQPELGIIDTTDYEPGDVDLGVPNDQFRRLIVSKTILLRNTRS